MLLQVDKINTFYGLSHILFDVSMQMDKGEVICILGRNGVGKSTLLRSIMGLTPASTGSIFFNALDIRGQKPFQIARLGVGFVPEDRVIFPTLTVKENLEIGLKGAGKVNWTFDRVYDMFPILNKRQTQMGGTLSGGEQQMLTIARTLMGNPQLLLLDEPSEGLSPLIVKELGDYISKLKTEHLPILMCEQNAAFTLKLSDRAYILEKGRVRWEGDVRTLKERPEVLRTYLGI